MVMANFYGGLLQSFFGLFKQLNVTFVILSLHFFKIAYNLQIGSVEV